MAMIEPMRLCEIVHVVERFRRAVNIAADYHDPRALDDYVLMPLSRNVLLRIVRGLGTENRTRAWSITGPYGAGKSATALLIARVLDHGSGAYAREWLRSKDPDLMEDLYDSLPGLRHGGYVTVRIVGSRQPVALSLLAGLMDSLTSNGVRGQALGQHMEHLRGLCDDAKSGDPLPASDIAEVIGRTADILQLDNPQLMGLCIIFDELGRALEFAALHPQQSDVGTLQVLAELTGRTNGLQVALVGILHQAFEQYAAGLSLVQQREWAKVQGRFEDIGFLASSAEMLHLTSRAIQLRSPPSQWLRVISGEVDQAIDLHLVPTGLDTAQAGRVLAGCAPLHPVVSLALGKLFRSALAQNERSLFAFLASGEPHGFQEYLAEETWESDGRRPFFRIDRLYDYVIASMGSGLYVRGRGKRWAEIEDALERLPRDSGTLEARLVKAIGLLGLLGDNRSVRASRAVLSFALADGRTASADDVSGALKRLEDWGIAIYRRFKDAYSLWQGSDVDLDERFDRGFAQIDRTQSLASLLERQGQVLPFVAKRHLHETGTLRHFALWVVDSKEIELVRTRTLQAADGAVVFVLDSSGEPLERVTTAVKDFSAQLESPLKEQLFFSLPQELKGISEAFEEVLTWEWVANNTPELEGDSVARLELAARQIAAQARLDRACAQCFDTALAWKSSAWIWSGEELALDSSKAISSALSDACDVVYRNAPIVKNELINRRNLSSAASAARRNLLEQMLANHSQPRLGMQGYPPEMSIYLSLLEQSGLHHREEGTWVFGPPQGDDTWRVIPLWHAIDGFLTTTEAAPRCVTELWDLLTSPPYGVREGLLAIYLTAAVLHWQAELALYEEGSFIPEVGPAELERLMRVPDRFSLQRYRPDIARLQMLQEYSSLFGAKTDPRKVSILAAVRPIMAFAKQLPPYTLMTESVSKEAVAVREALHSAREPHTLLFESLPRSVGIDLLEDAESVPAYFARLKRALMELQHAYENLLASIERLLLDAFLLPSDSQAARCELARRAGVLKDLVGDLELKALLLRASDTDRSRTEWLESIAGLLASKPVSRWNDQDIARYRVALQDIAGRFRRAEELALSESRGDASKGSARILRVAVTDLEGREFREVVQIHREQEAELDRVVDTLERSLPNGTGDRRMRMMALAELVRRVLESLHSSEDSSG